MTVSTVKFYKMRGSLSSGEYPLFANGQNLSSYLIHSVETGHPGGLQTHVTIPSFTGYDTVNIAEIDSNYYWVTSWRESTTVNGSITFTLDFMGPTSFYRLGDSIKGKWHKTPYKTCPYLRDEITNDVMLESSSIRPSNIEVGTTMVDLDNNPEHLGFWYQIIGYDSNGDIKKWGGFMPFTIDQQRFITNTHVMVTYNITPGGPRYYYPNLYDLIKNVNRYTGLNADRIIDFSVSARCPYKINKDTSNPLYYLLTLNDYSGDPIQPTEVYSGAGPDIGDGTFHYYLYDITNYPFQQIKQTITMTMTDKELAIGMIGLKDWNGNIIMSLPNKASRNIEVQTLGDLNGIHTVVRTDNTSIAIPEGKLPYLSNTWADYVAYQMDTDRQSMENAIKYARYENESNTMSGVANTGINAVSTGVMTGAIAGNIPGAIMGMASGIIGAGVSLWENDRALKLAEMKASDNYYLSQRQARLEPQTAYNVGYGTIYCTLNAINPLRFVISMPANIGTNYYNNWVSEFGYPAEGVISLTASAGFYQGSCLSENSDQSGMFWDECNKTFMQGFKFITIT